MKTADKQKQADYLLLHFILGKYLEKCLDDEKLAPRYFETEEISDIVNPFLEIKRFIQRIEWLKDDEYITELLEYLVKNKMTVEELLWGIDMFAVEKQEVFDRIVKRIRGYE